MQDGFWAGPTSVFVLTPSIINGERDIVLEKVAELGWSQARTILKLISLNLETVPHHTTSRKKIPSSSTLPFTM